jgi:predicted TIM-barrel enzyme
VGCNFLDIVIPTQALRTAGQAGIPGLWTDNACLEDFELLSVMERYRQDCDVVYFGGVAFKYQKQVDFDDLFKEAEYAAQHMDISGPGTGKAAAVQKIERIKQGAREVPVAIASGISAANVKEYLLYADAFLVATSISKDWHQFDPDKLKQLIETVREGT